VNSLIQLKCIAGIILTLVKRSDKCKVVKNLKFEAPPGNWMELFVAQETKWNTERDCGTHYKNPELAEPRMELLMWREKLGRLEDAG